MIKTFTVTKCTETEKKTFVWTLVVNEEATVMGLKKNIKRTYYLGGMPSAVEVGTEVKDDTKFYDVVERPCYQKLVDAANDTYDIVETEDEADRVLQLKWMHRKVEW